MSHAMRVYALTVLLGMFVGAELLWWDDRADVVSAIESATVPDAPQRPRTMMENLLHRARETEIQSNMTEARRDLFATRDEWYRISSKLGTVGYSSAEELDRYNTLAGLADQNGWA